MQSDELGPEKLAAMSKAEMAMRTEDPSLLTSWKKKGKGGKVRSAANNIISQKSLHHWGPIDNVIERIFRMSGFSTHKG